MKLESAGNEQDIIVDIARNVVAPLAERTYNERRWPEEGIRALQQAGLAGLTIPRDMGGIGAGAYGLAQACESLGEECASTAICFGMHCVGSSVISANATPEQIESLLQPICRGEHLTTLALSEPGTGVHFYLPMSEIRPADGGFRINGEKTFVTNGSHADSYVLSGVSAEDGVSFSCLVVREGSEGMDWRGSWSGMGMRGNSSIGLKLDQVFAPAECLLGNEGDQIWYVFNVIAPYFLVAMSGTYLGVASAAFELARKHLVERSYAHSGEMLAHAPVLQHRIGRLWGELERIRQQVYAAARKFDHGAADALPAVMAAKADVADAGVRIVNEAMTLCGGQAYRDGGKLQRLLHDMRAAHVMAPTTDTLRTWIGRAVMDLPILGD